MKTFISIALIILAIPLYAQDDDLPEESNPTVRERIQAARVAYITDQLALTPTEAEKFWPIYREFTDKRKVLLKELRYARRHPDASKSADQNEKDLVTLGLEVKQKEVDLERQYSEQLLNVIPAQKVRMLPEVERKFRMLLLKQIQERRRGREKD
jgi:hypothetical protein